MKTMKVEQLTGLETIDPTPTTPWNAPPFVKLTLNQTVTEGKKMPQPYYHLRAELSTQMHRGEKAFLGQQQ
jgi:hypothetical protein